MTTDEREAALREAMLRELDSCGNHAVPVRALCNAMYAQVSPAPTKAEIERALLWLDDEGYVSAARRPLGGGMEYMITTSGRAALHA